MTTSGPSDTDEIRIETSLPGAMRMSIHITPALADDIAVAFEAAGGQVSGEVVELSAPDDLRSVLEVAGPIAASGVTVARVLKQWWHRNDGKKVRVTFNGEAISLEGMSAEEMARIMDLARDRWDERWRQQFPNRLPDRNDSGERDEIERPPS